MSGSVGSRRSGNNAQKTPPEVKLQAFWNNYKGVPLPSGDYRKNEVVSVSTPRGMSLLKQVVRHFDPKPLFQSIVVPGKIMTFNVAGWMPQEKTFQHVAIRMQSGTPKDGRDLNTSPWLLLDQRVLAGGVDSYEVDPYYPIEILGLGMCEEAHAGIHSKEAYDFDATVRLQYEACKPGGDGSRASVTKVVLKITYLHPRPAGANGVQASFVATLPPHLRASFVSARLLLESGKKLLSVGSYVISSFVP